MERPVGAGRGPRSCDRHAGLVAGELLRGGGDVVGVDPGLLLDLLGGVGAAVSRSRTSTCAIPRATIPSVPGAHGRNRSAAAAVIESRGPKWTTLPRIVSRSPRIRPYSLA